MNIKSLLLGSAAALLAVSGARAADVIPPMAAAPEPMDYVKVCDVYGAGFYYIPGTQTCMQISGYLRFREYYASDIGNREGDDYQATSRVRARVNLDVREETELGTLRAFIRFQAENTGTTGGAASSGFGPGDQAFGLDQGYLQLGGLYAGYTESLWVSPFGGGGDTAFGLLTDDGLAYGYQERNQIGYTFAAGGFAATLGLEDDGTGDAMPDVVGKLAYNTGFGTIYAIGAYDERVDGVENGFDLSSYDGGPVGHDDGAFAVKAGFTLDNLIAANSTFKVEGTYSFDPSAYSVTTSTLFGSATNFPLEWSAGAAYSQAFGKFGVTLAGQYAKSFDLPFSNDNFDYINIETDLTYAWTKNFRTLLNIEYNNFNGDGIAPDGDQWLGFLELRRSF